MLNRTTINYLRDFAKNIFQSVCNIKNTLYNIDENRAEETIYT